MNTKLQQFLMDAPFAQIKVFKYLLRYTDGETGVIDFNPLYAACRIADMSQEEFTHAVVQLFVNDRIKTESEKWFVCNIRTISQFHPVGKKRTQRPRFNRRYVESRVGSKISMHADGTSSVTA